MSDLDIETEQDDDPYGDGLDLGQFMAGMRDEGDGSYDCRYDLADAAKKGTDYFNEFKRGLEDGLTRGDTP